MSDANRKTKEADAHRNRVLGGGVEKRRMKGMTIVGKAPKTKTLKMKGAKITGKQPFSKTALKDRRVQAKQILKKKTKVAGK